MKPECTPDTPHECIVCKSFTWDDYIELEKGGTISPFGVLVRSAYEGCHLSAVIYGALKASEPPEGFTVLSELCECIIDPTTTMSIAAGLGSVFVQVDCQHSGGAKHKAVLPLSSLSHNGMIFQQNLWSPANYVQSL